MNGSVLRAVPVLEDQIQYRAHYDPLAGGGLKGPTREERAVLENVVGPRKRRDSKRDSGRR